MLEVQKIELFLQELTKLSRRYRIKIEDGGICDQAELEEMSDDEMTFIYQCYAWPTGRFDFSGLSDDNERTCEATRFVAIAPRA